MLNRRLVPPSLVRVRPAPRNPGEGAPDDPSTPDRPTVHDDAASHRRQVWATGTNTAIDDTNTATACTGYVPTGRVCAWRMYYEDIFSGMAGVGASGVVLG